MIFNTSLQFFRSLTSTYFVIPTTFTISLEADLRAITFPIPIDTIKISTEVLISNFLEVFNETDKVLFWPLFKWE
jgi:hypothetical protein